MPRRKATRATSRREALALLAELEAQTSRVRLGLEAPPVIVRDSFWSLLDWWLEERCPPASRAMERMRLEKHLKHTELGRTPLALVTADFIERRLEQLEKDRPDEGPTAKGLAPGSINRLRTSLHAAFAAASRPPRRWGAANPVALTRRRRVERKVLRVLSPEEIQRVLAYEATDKRAALHWDSWRGVMAVAAYLGLRKGEILGLRKGDWDARRRTLRVASSYQRAGTKTGRIDELPVPDVLVPYLERAARRRGPWLFPDSRGKPRTRESDPHLVLRTVCAAVGIVDHWELWCRRCKAQGRPLVRQVQQTEPRDVRCSRHHTKLWVRAVPPRIRFHDLRHSCATNLLKAGVPLAHVARVVRHASIRTTNDIYGHLSNEDLRLALDRAYSDSTASHRFTPSHTVSGPK
ncbi:MAG: site-specific integrase [Myxococcaceae bacterium]|nr:site-specific integrase [Myxococcaceae bacterium]